MNETPSGPVTAAVLVTGGAGFIGSHLADAFLALGHRVVVLDDLSSGDLSRLPPSAAFVRGDLRTAPLGELIADERIGVVLHHAAQVDVRRSVSDPATDAEINVVGTIRVAAACAAAGVGQLVFASSGGAIYGDPSGGAAPREEDELNPCSPYGVAKLAGERYLRALRPEGGYRLAILRYANVYGPRQDGAGEAGVVGIFMNRLLGGEDAVVNGDGGQTRDFVHVADVVAANLAAVARRFDGTLNVGTGVETSVLDLYTLVARACGVEKPPRFGPAKAGEQRRSVLDPSRSREALELASPVPLAEGLAATAEWFRMHRARTGLS